MAKRSKKTVDVQKFGGVDDVGSFVERNAIDAPVKDVGYDLKDIEVESQTHLEDDHGGGGAAIIRMFQFGMNPQAFKEYVPTKQELFNSHYKGIEMALWKDGMSVMPEINPRIVVDSKSNKYMIFVGAKPMKGHLLQEQPRTLAEQIHGRG